jgi:hypothetical protein
VRGSRLLDGPVDVQPFEDLLPAHQAGTQARVTALTKRIALVHIGCMRDRKSPGTTGTLSSLVSGSSAVARALGAASSGSERNRPSWDGASGDEIQDQGGEQERDRRDADEPRHPTSDVRRHEPHLRRILIPLVAVSEGRGAGDGDALPDGGTLVTARAGAEEPLHDRS